MPLRASFGSHSAAPSPLSSFPFSPVAFPARLIAEALLHKELALISQVLSKGKQ